jgi:lipopolysaccharide export system protein LptA
MIVVFVGLVVSYRVYGHFLGGIDGLTPLPEEFWPPDPDGPVELTVASLGHRNRAEDKLIKAFTNPESKNPDCPELKRINKLEIPSRNMVLAVDKFEPVREGKHKGQILLQPFSAAIFGKGAEINTIKSKEAYLTFDRPINSISEVGRAKIMAAELIGDVEIANNRRTPKRDDDLSLTTDGPVYYDEPTHHIFTDKEVCLKDLQSRPDPMTITAVGMDVYLTTPEANSAKTATSAAGDKKNNRMASANKDQGEAISGVERILLRTQVQMDLYVDPRSGFMAETSPRTTAASAPSSAGNGRGSPPGVPSRDHVQITTQGPFNYDVNKDFAVFEISHKPTPLPSRVHVTRIHSEPGSKDERKDELFCDRLELQFHRKEAPPDPARAAPEAQDRAVELDIDTARALQLQDEAVSVISFAEVFNASCYDLFYDARTKVTTLKGNPNNRENPDMLAMKEGNLIRSRELRLTAADSQKPQQVTAKGPGRIDLLDREKGERTSHALWKDLLTSTKDGTYDLLILTGDASFQDQERGEIQGDQIKVWLEPAKPQADSPAGKPRDEKPTKPQDDNAVAEQQQRLKPHHLEATRRVHLHSPELNLEEADHLLIWFKDAPATGIPSDPGFGEPPATGKSATRGELTSSTGSEQKRMAGNFSPPPAGNPLPIKGNDSGFPRKDPQSEANATSKPKKPLNVKARDVKAHVIRTDNRNDLESLVCEGTVRVKQDPASPEDKGVDIRGDSLQLNHFVDGNILMVTGNARELAWVQLDKLTMKGKEVNIDQRANRAWINDIGVMQILAATDFEGNKLAQPSQLTIHWNKEMQFDGKRALFSGGVAAEQNNSHLRCQEMQVTLDRPVSFKEGERNGPPAKVEHLVCDRGQSKQPVVVEDTKFEGSKVVSYQRLHCQEMHVDNQEGKMQASGPGILNLLQLGSAEEEGPLSSGASKPSQPRTSGVKEELQLTRVYYFGRMHADNKKRLATFYDDIKVFHLPADDPDIQVDEAHPPAGCMILRCKMLKVLSEALPNGQKNQTMLATGQVRIQGRSQSATSTKGAANSGNDSPDYWGDAQVLKYDEKSDWIILDGGEGYAHLYRVLAPGANPDRVEARKIHYNRKDRTYKAEGISNIQGTR